MFCLCWSIDLYGHAFYSLLLRTKKTINIFADINYLVFIKVIPVVKLQNRKWIYIRQLGVKR